jgi:hypothetical protein
VFPARRAGAASRDRALSARLQHLTDLAARAEASSHNRAWGGLVTAELIDRTQRERAWIDDLGRQAGQPQ